MPWRKDSIARRGKSIKRLFALFPFAERDDRETIELLKAEYSAFARIYILPHLEALLSG